MSRPSASASRLAGAPWHLLGRLCEMLKLALTVAGAMSAVVSRTSARTSMVVNASQDLLDLLGDMLKLTSMDAVALSAVMAMTGAMKMAIAQDLLNCWSC